MDNPRPEKVAVVDEVRKRFSDSDAALLTEYRGINVTDMQTLRRALREAGGDYKIYKNTLVRFATRDLGLELDEMLTGPTAIAFVPTDGTGDPVMVAKALRDFAKGNPSLVVKGGILGEKILSEGDAKALADIAPREELLAKLAGLMAAPMQQLAGLLQAVPRDFAYGLQALIEKNGGVETPAAPDTSTDTETTDTTEAPEAAPESEAVAAEEAPTAEAETEPAGDNATEES
jgi:large subunit ribosomal protein L10